MGAVLADLAGFAGCRLAARSTRSWIIRVCRHVCTSRQISSSSGKTSQIVRSLYDCPEVPIGPEGVLYRVVVATHQASKKKSPVGVTREGTVNATLLHEFATAGVHRLRCRRAVSASRSL